MSALAQLLVAAFAVLTSPFAPAPAPPNPLQLARHLVFDASLEQFITTADSPLRDPRLDWTSDGCSAPITGDSGMSFNFRRPCRRHDFAYRNFSRLNGGLIWTPSMRRRVDEQFLRDMRETCSPRPWSATVRCNAWAETYFRAVRTFWRD